MQTTETQVMGNFALSRQFRMANNFHAHGNLLIFPWGFITNFYTPDHSAYVAWGQNMTQFNNYVDGTANQTVGYLVNGEANDWLYGEQIQKTKVFGFTTEVGTGSDGFWPSPSRIIPLANENVYPNLVLAAGDCERAVHQHNQLRRTHHVGHGRIFQFRGRIWPDH